MEEIRDREICPVTEPYIIGMTDLSDKGFKTVTIIFKDRGS